MKQSIGQFQEVVWDYYRHNARVMPWRLPMVDGSFDPYTIMVSEIMLQQTQVSRVIPKFESFIGRFPDTASLAKAPLAEVLTVWSGLGYNRRAKFLHEAAKQIESDHHGIFPESLTMLSALPGIGIHTAGAILAYAYNQPVVFIETNIRTVFIHHFFRDTTELISDKELRPYIEASLDHENPREWYWALMDYGAYVKSAIGNQSRHSKQYVRQTPFKDSLRALRGQVVRDLTRGPLELTHLRQSIDDDRFDQVLDALKNDGLIIQHNNLIRLAD